MEVAGWKPVDLLVGGMLTAGLAFGVYKFGRLGRRAAAVGGAAMASELDATNLQDCIALAGRPSELEVAVLPQPDGRCRQLASSLKKSMEEGKRAASDRAARSLTRDGSSDDLAPHPDSTSLRNFFSHLCAETKRELRELFDMERLGGSPDQSPCQHRPLQRDPYFSPLMVERSSPELTRQLQAYRDTLDKWTADTEAKIEKMEEQRLSLATELRVTREALQAERRLRAEAEQRRQRAEAQLQELEGRLERCMERKGEATEREAEVRRLEQQVQEMEDQLELLYLHNVVTPRHAAQHNHHQQQQLSHSLEQAQSQLDTQQSQLTDMDNEMASLHAQINKMRTDSRQLSEENTSLQKQLHSAHQAARQLVALLFERSAGQADDGSHLTELLSAPDSDLPLDRLLECVTTLLQQS